MDQEEPRREWRIQKALERIHRAFPPTEAVRTAEQSMALANGRAILRELAEETEDRAAQTPRA